MGVHLPQLDLDGSGLSARRLTATAAAARDLGYVAVSANDHLDFAEPWLDGLTALTRASAVSGPLELMTSVALPTIRRPAPLAAALAALARLAGGPVVAGVGPGSSAADHELVGQSFADRWPSFDQATRQLRALLDHTSRAPASVAVAPAPIPVWVASWGSPAGLRRVARLGEGWVASAYNASPCQFADRLSQLGDELARRGRTPQDFPHALVTLWLRLGDDQREADRVIDRLARTLGRDPADLRDRVCVGSAAQGLDLLARYAAAGCRRVHVWPIGDEAEQLSRLAEDVLPRIDPAGRRPGG